MKKQGREDQDKKKKIILLEAGGVPLAEEEIYKAVKDSLDIFCPAWTSKKDLKVLIIPPDLTRAHSYAGPLTGIYYDLLKDRARVDILPALGTHDPMTEEECAAMYGDHIPFDRYIVHNWRDDVVSIGTVPADFIEEISDGLFPYEIDVKINKLIVEGAYDLILSIGQIVPHEVAGMANYSKNILVGCAGVDVINKTHMLGAVCGMEDAMGKDFSPVRLVLDYAQERFLKDLPVLYVLTVTRTEKEKVRPLGIFIGKDREVFEEGVALSSAENIVYLDQAIKTAVAYLNPEEFRSTWLGNKAIYRSRMAMADDGHLIVMAPGVSKFGEDGEIDALIRKYGYRGSEEVNALVAKNKDLRDNMSAAAHLIHGSSEGRFKISYAVRHLSREEIEGVGYNYLPYEEAEALYDLENYQEGWNLLPGGDGEKLFYISNPALGLWAVKDKDQDL